MCVLERGVYLVFDGTGRHVGGGRYRSGRHSPTEDGPGSTLLQPGENHGGPAVVGEAILWV